MNLLIYTDGASRGNPGISASGFRIYDDAHKLLKQGVLYNGIATNNEAEYKAIIAALKAALVFGAVEIALYSDSKLAINQLMGNFKIKSGNLKKLNNETKELLHKFKKYTLENPRRSNEYISAVDKDLNVFLDSVEKKERGQKKLK
ncbi:MAG: ribonuclease HI family protein [Candidatus Micrarchaeaceae archaeon]